LFQPYNDVHHEFLLWRLRLLLLLQIIFLFFYGSMFGKASFIYVAKNP